MDVETDERKFRERLTVILGSTPMLMRALSMARHLCLPDWLVFSGAVYQPVFNHLTGRPLDYGIKDYDLGYFDTSDLSYDAEDAVIRLVKGARRAVAKYGRGSQPSSRASLVRGEIRRALRAALLYGRGIGTFRLGNFRGRRSVGT
jgi:hypothetical protein